MTNWRIDVTALDAKDVRRGTREPAGRPSHLYLITEAELASLRRDLAGQNVPPDLEAKLSKLAAGTLAHRFIEQNCRTMIALLHAADQGAFTQASQAQRDRLLRVLAYVRKDDDAIPDYRADGFLDDRQEVRALTSDLAPLLQEFKAWRLRHQVPGLWLAERACVMQEVRLRQFEMVAG